MCVTAEFFSLLLFGAFSIVQVPVIILRETPQHQQLLSWVRLDPDASLENTIRFLQNQDLKPEESFTQLSFFSRV